MHFAILIRFKYIIVTVTELYDVIIDRKFSGEIILSYALLFIISYVWFINNSSKMYITQIRRDFRGTRFYLDSKPTAV